MTKDIYARPPITEAVIQISFLNPYDGSKIHKFIKKHNKYYPEYQEIIKYHLDVVLSNNLQHEPKAQATPDITHRLSSKDMTQQLLLNKSSFVISQLAPYCGWDDFINRFKRDWEAWKKFFGFNDIKQIGVRYINRLDIPAPEQKIDFSEYVNIYPEIPDTFDPNSSYAMQTIIPINELKCGLRLNTAVVKSPLLNHMSLVIDQDIIRADDLPQKDEAIYKLLDEIHEKKNSVFESCIKDKARELFNS